MKGTLLIVDDEPILLKQLSLMLSDTADEVFTAANGIEALKLLEEKKIHCVICDINMPKMNGVEVLKAMRGKDQNTPFIFYTGHGNHDLMMEAAKYGAFDFLDKPNLDGLEEVVSRGLALGCSEENPTDKTEGDFISEYQKLLKQMELHK